MHHIDLTPPQLLDVLRASDTVLLSMSSDGQPYAVPMSYTLDADGAVPILRMRTSAYSLKAAILRCNPRVCLSLLRTGCAWTDAVTGLGEAVLTGGDRQLDLAVPCTLLTGRRFFTD